MIGVNCFPTFSSTNVVPSSFPRHSATGASYEHPHMRISCALSTLNTQEDAGIFPYQKSCKAQLQETVSWGHWQTLNKLVRKLAS